MSYLIKPAGYKALLNLSQTEMVSKDQRLFPAKPVFRITVAACHSSVVRLKRDGYQ